jgi:hypothetical protein
MGKRELVLIAAFLVVGIVVYQFTAPPPPPGSEGVSVGGIFQKLKREVRGARENATAESKGSLPVDPSIHLLRINLPRANDLTVVGTDRSDVTVEMRVTARGYDQAAAKATADAARVTLETAGDAVVASSTWSNTRRNNNSEGFVVQSTITLSVPRRLNVRLEPHIGELVVRDVAAVELMGSRGDTEITGTSGPIVLTHGGGKLTIDRAASLKLTGRNSEGTIKNIAGTFSVDLTSGELRVQDIVGPIDIEARNNELQFDAAKTSKPPFRFNGTGGQLRIENLRSEARIDGRNVDLEVALSAAAPITIYSTGSDITVTAPPGGYSIDAVATEGRLVLNDGTLKAADEHDQRVTGAIRGGGATLTLRATRADIRLRKPEGK